MINSLLGGVTKDDAQAGGRESERLAFETRKLRIFESDSVFASVRSGCELRRLREHEEYVSHYKKLLPSMEFAVWRRVNDFTQHMRRIEPVGINLISWPK